MSCASRRERSPIGKLEALRIVATTLLEKRTPVAAQRLDVEHDDGCRDRGEQNPRASHHCMFVDIRPIGCEIAA